jgi:hypothetical protein
MDSIVIIPITLSSAAASSPSTTAVSAAGTTTAATSPEAGAAGTTILGSNGADGSAATSGIAGNGGDGSDVTLAAPFPTLTLDAAVLSEGYGFIGLEVGPSTLSRNISCRWRLSPEVDTTDMGLARHTGRGLVEIKGIRRARR